MERPVAVVPAQAYPDKYAASQWPDPGLNAGLPWYDDRPAKGKRKGELKGGKGSGDVGWSKGGWTAPNGSTNGHGYADKREANWGGKMGLPLPDAERMYGEGKGGAPRGGYPAQPRHDRPQGWAKPVTDGWEPLFATAHDDELPGRGTRGDVFYDIGQDLLAGTGSFGAVSRKGPRPAEAARPTAHPGPAAARSPGGVGPAGWPQPSYGLAR